MPAPELRTGRLSMRPWAPADREPFAAMNSDPEVMRFLRRPLTRAESDAFVARIEASWATRGYGLWAVEVLGGPAFIGYVGLWDALFDAPFTPAVEVGWRLARAAWGNGYATEAARAAVDFGHGSVRLPEVLSFTAAINLRSRAVMERIGLVHQPEGDFDHPLVPLGDPLRSHVLYRFPERVAASSGP